MHVLRVDLSANRSAFGRASGSLKLGVAALATGAVLLAGAAAAVAKGGTAKPPPAPVPAPGTANAPLVTILPPAGPVLQTPVSTATGFSVTGFIAAATVDGGCPVPGGPPVGLATDGGTALVNGQQIVIPTNVIVQFPANTFTWRDAICPAQGGVSPLGLDGISGGNGGLAAVYPATEITFDGNVVGGEFRAALVHISQQSLHSGAGVISFIDYTDGSIYVTSGAAGSVSEVRLLINDPNGRFGRAQSNPDARFSVDDANPTIKTGATGYPMCVPRVAPAAAGQPEADPLCPQINRPIQNAALNNCRTFTQSGIAIPAGGEITSTPSGVACRAFVMKAVTGMPGTLNYTANQQAANLRAATDPDPREQAPFMVGDYISWGGTLVRDGSGGGASGRTVTSTDTIWVHTIDANVGIYTQPKTLPSYVAIGEFGIGVDPNPTGTAVTPGVEATARIFLEAGVSDVGAIVDVYLDDKGYVLNNANGPITPGAGEYFRWVTVEGMTGTLADQLAGKNPFITTVQPFGGGIQTQFTGPQSGRARIRANKVPPISTAPGIGACPSSGGSQACAVTQSPTRYLRAVVRSLCAPAAGFPANTPANNPGSLDGGAFFSINSTRPLIKTDGTPGSAKQCLESAVFANSLFTGQYMAPVGEYIFPENTLAGAPILPNNLWQLDFLVSGEGGSPGTSSGGVGVIGGKIPY